MERIETGIERRRQTSKSVITQTTATIHSHSIQRRRISFEGTHDAIFEHTYGFGPLASSMAGFTNGRDVAKEPNVVPILNENGDFDFKIVLDYNPFIPDTNPLLNSVSVLRFGQYF